MSEFVECTTKFKDQKALIEALMEMGWKKNEIEIHDKATHLYGYHGDRRAQTANIIIRRQHVGGSSNDIGFLKKSDGTYEGIISEFDRTSGGKHARETHGYNENWLKKLNGAYNEKLYTRVAKQKGFEVRKKVEGKKVILTLYR